MKIGKVVFAAIAVMLVAVTTSCEPTVTGQGRIDTYFHIPYCPTTDSAFYAADSVPLGCTVPDSGLGLRMSPIMVDGDGSWLKLIQ